MTSIANQKKMRITSDYPMDKIMFLTSGSATVNNGTSDLSPGISIAHGLPFSPLPFLVWSNTSDFAVSNTWFDAAYSSTAFTTAAGQKYDVSADGTNVYINRYNNSGSSKTLYYRIFCFAPSDAGKDSEVEFTSNQADSFVLNSDYNYMKLAFTGSLTSGSDSFTHGLGFVPRVMAWQKVSSTYSPIIAAQLIDTDPTGSGAATSGLHITSTQIKWLNPTTYDAIDYRIYLEE